MSSTYEFYNVIMLHRFLFIFTDMCLDVKALSADGMTRDRRLNRPKLIVDFFIRLFRGNELDERTSNVIHLQLRKINVEPPSLPLESPFIGPRFHFENISYYCSSFSAFLITVCMSPFLCSVRESFHFRRGNCCRVVEVYAGFSLSLSFYLYMVSILHNSVKYLSAKAVRRRRRVQRENGRVIRQQSICN